MPRYEASGVRLMILYNYYRNTAALVMPRYEASGVRLMILYNYYGNTAALVMPRYEASEYRFFLRQNDNAPPAAHAKTQPLPIIQEGI